MSRHIVVLAGDGIGPEVTAAAVEVLHALDVRLHLGLSFAAHAFGGAAIDAYADPFPDHVQPGRFTCLVRRRPQRGPAGGGNRIECGGLLFGHGVGAGSGVNLAGTRRRRGSIGIPCSAFHLKGC